jgi:hypothetical protein
MVAATDRPVQDVYSKSRTETIWQAVQLISQVAVVAIDSEKCRVQDAVVRFPVKVCFPRRVL